jgi:hypothetical protein
MALKARPGLPESAASLLRNLTEDASHGAKPLQVEGIAKPIAPRVISPGLGGPTLLTAEARAARGDTLLGVQSYGQ